MSAEQCKEWAEECKKQMKEKGISFDKKAVFLTGEKYYKYLEGTFSEEELPLDGKPIGKSLEWLAHKVGAVDEGTSLRDYIDAYLWPL